METQNKVFLAAMGWLAFFAIGAGVNLAYLAKEGWELTGERKVYLIASLIGILSVLIQLIVIAIAEHQQNKK